MLNINLIIILLFIYKFLFTHSLIILVNIVTNLLLVFMLLCLNMYIIYISLYILKSTTLIYNNDDSRIINIIINSNVFCYFTKSLDSILINSSIP